MRKLLLLSAILILPILLVMAALAIVLRPERTRPLLPTALAVLLPPPLPDGGAPRVWRRLDQNWSADESQWVHHASQGAATLPVSFAWFVALEQPRLSLSGEPGLLSDPAYLARMGFIPSDKGRARGHGGTAPSTHLGWDEAENDAGLPVGFARTKIEGAPERIGLTCSACHTGHIDYQGVSLVVEGGPARLNLNALEHALGLSLFYTLKVPGRFERFAARVLGAQATPAQRDAPRAQVEKLRADVQETFERLIALAQVTGSINAASGETPTPEGFFRLDALNRIGDRLFFEDIGASAEHAANHRATTAPVRFPALWDAPWFKWAEYDSSIQQPLVRNVGEALGVGAQVKLEGVKLDGPQIFNSTVALNNIVWIEDLLRGGDPFAGEKPAFSGLTAPKWPQKFFPADKAWVIDAEKVGRGRALYAEICAACHLGPPNDPEFDRLYPGKAFWSSPAWERDADGTGLNVKEIPLEDIGTDPGQARVLRERMVDLPENFGFEPVSQLNDKWGCGLPSDGATPMRQPFALALMATVDKASRAWLDTHGVSESDRSAVFGPRRNCPRAPGPPVYRARPLDGVWAVAPYLHNGAAPSLDALLRPAAQRPKTFCLGGRDYDPGLVGYDAAAPCRPGESVFAERDETGKAIAGNSTAGHSFENGPTGRGVVGRALDQDERAALIEYLKTL